MKNSNLLNISIGGLIIICVIFASAYYNKSNKLKLANYNLSALGDTLKVTKNKANQNVYKINSLLLNYKQLKNTNNELVNEINNLNKDDKKHLVEINKLNLTINLLKDSVLKLNNKLIDSIYDPTTQLTTYNYELKDSTKFRELKGTIKVKSSIRPFQVNTNLTSDKVLTDLVIGKTLKNDKLELFVSSSNPSLVVNNIEGSVIDLKAYNKFQTKKRFSIGIQFGYGFTLNGLSPYVGIGGSYNLINF